MSLEPVETTSTRGFDRKGEGKTHHHPKQIARPRQSAPRTVEAPSSAVQSLRCTHSTRTRERTTVVRRRRQERRARRDGTWTPLMVVGR